MSELFDIPETLSPRLAWMKKHGLKTFNCNRPDIIDPWTCYNGDLEKMLENGEQGYGAGKTEDEAIVDWATVNGVRLWNEENL